MNPMNFDLLRPHQQRGTIAMLKYRKGQIIVPTGGGKTLKMIYDGPLYPSDVSDHLTL